MYKLCILAAGKGTRNKYVRDNKALLPLGKGTALSYIIDKFPPEIEIVIAVGYNAQLVSQYTFRGWQRNITCVEVEYEGYEKGPGFSLLQCAWFLQCPFIYMACDTIVTDEIPAPSRNWLGVSLVKDNGSYTTVATEEGLVTALYDKGDNKATTLAHIGLVGVWDYRTFWKGLSAPIFVDGEYSDTSGIKSLISHNLCAIPFLWLDIGTTEGYENAKQYFDMGLSQRAIKNS